MRKSLYILSFSLIVVLGAACKKAPKSPLFTAKSGNLADSFKSIKSDEYEDVLLSVRSPGIVTDQETASTPACTEGQSVRRLMSARGSCEETCRKGDDVSSGYDRACRQEGIYEGRVDRQSGSKLYTWNGLQSGLRFDDIRMGDDGTGKQIPISLTATFKVHGDVKSDAANGRADCDMKVQISGTAKVLSCDCVFEKISHYDCAGFTRIIDMLKQIVTNPSSSAPAPGTTDPTTPVPPAPVDGDNGPTRPTDDGSAPPAPAAGDAPAAPSAPAPSDPAPAAPAAPSAPVAPAAPAPSAGDTAPVPTAPVTPPAVPAPAAPAAPAIAAPAPTTGDASAPVPATPPAADAPAAPAAPSLGDAAAPSAPAVPAPATPADGSGTTTVSPPAAG